MIDWEILAAYVAGWSLQKLRLVDKELDIALDQGVRRLHDVVASKLSRDTAWQDMVAEAAHGDIGELTRRRVALAMQAAVEQDSAFAAAVKEAVGDIPAPQQPATASTGQRAAAVTGTTSSHAEDNSAAQNSGTDPLSRGPRSSGMRAIVADRGIRPVRPPGRLATAERRLAMSGGVRTCNRSTHCGRHGEGVGPERSVTSKARSADAFQPDRLRNSARHHLHGREPRPERS